MGKKTTETSQTDDYRRGLLRLSLVLEEQSAVFEPLMSELRAVLRDKNGAGTRVDELLSEAEDTQEHQTTTQAKQQEKLASVLHEMNDQLRAQSPEPSRELDELGHGLDLRTRDFNELTLYLWEFKDIQKLVLEKLSNISQARKALDTADQAVDAEPGAVPIKQMTSDVFNAVSGLANRIQIPADQQSALQGIIHDLNRTIDWGDLIALLHRLIELIVSVLNAEQQALEQYLEDLNQRLSFIRASVQKAQAIRNDFQQEGKRLDARIQGHVESIRQEVSKATSLNQLKEGISHELDDIVNSIDHFLQESAEKERSMADMMAELVNIITDLEEQNQSIRDDFERTRKQALTDLLTGLPNRSAYVQRQKEEIARMKRYGTPLTLCVLDVDYFKTVNDKLGHSAGDKVLKILARQLQRLLRENDFISRHGGEEFVILLPGTDITDAVTAMEKLRALVEETPFHFRGKPMPITVSIGCAEFGAEEDADDVFERADRAMYRAKDLGRNRVES